MKALASLKELASSVGRTKESSTAAPARDLWKTGSAAEYVDEQIALLVETIEAEARNRNVQGRDGAVRERRAAPVGSRKRPPLVRSPGPTVPARLLRRFRGWQQQVLPYVAAALLAVTVGALLGVTFGR